jgi:hypothetical protein
MANNLSSNTEQSSLRTNDSQSVDDHSSHQNFFKEFATSAAYSGLEQPVLGLSQFLGKETTNKVSGFFDEFGIEAPKPQEFKSSGWTAQTLGGAVGMLLPFALTKSALGKAGVFGEAASAESGSLLSSRSALGLSLKESAATGFAYGAFLTPSKQTDNLGTLLIDRVAGGIGSAATFTSLTAGSIGLGRLAETSVASRLGIASALKNPIASGVLAGLPGGIASSEFDSLTKNRTLASSSELEQSIAGMALVGGVFGAKAVVAPHIAGGAGYIADNLRAKFNTPKFETSSQFPGGTGRDITEPLPIIHENSADTNAQPQDTNATRQDANIKPPPVKLLPEEHDLLTSINNAKTIDQWRQASNQVQDLRSETSSWFTETLDKQAKSLTSSELQSLWPELLKEDPHQAYRIARQIGPAETTELWQSQLESVRQTGDPALAGELAKTMVFVEPSAQQDALKGLLQLDQPPAGVNMASSLLAPENQIPAAKMLVEQGIQPYFEMSRTSSTDWSKWIFDRPPGETREALVKQLSRKVSGSARSAPEEVNQIFHLAQEKAVPEEFESLRAMLKGVDPRHEGPANIGIRKTALDSLDPKFISRLQFYEGDWDAADKLAQTNPELVKALTENSRLNSSLRRSRLISSMMTAEPPLTASGLAESMSNLAQNGMEAGKKFPLTYGDLEALAEHGPKPAPEEVAPLLIKLRQDALQAFDMEGNGPQQISAARLLSDMTFANSLGKTAPELFQKEFKDPIEAAMADGKLSYDRRLEAARTLGELQRTGFDATQSIHMPELRMGKLADLTRQQQTEMRTTVEAALSNRAAMVQLLGDGPLGRLMPSVFGDARDGGIVGRKQHEVHDNTVDVHLLDVVEKASQDPRFAKLLPKDQVNTLWASFLHDVSKRANMVDLDHGWTSTSTAWGVLRTLGYPDTQIQRITDIMARDFDLSYDPDNKNSVRFEDQKLLDHVVTAYREPGALDMVSILNSSDIKSVKADGSWYRPEVIDELEKIRSMAQDRVDELNKHLLPVMTNGLPEGFGVHQMSDYSLMAHTSPDLAQLLKHRSTVESPEFSMSVSLVTPEHQKLYSDESQIVALVNGPFEHIAQAHRGNLSTGQSVGWDGHVELVRRWATDFRASRLAEEAENRLAALNIPPDSRTAPENYPRLANMRRILSQFENLDELTQAAGKDNPYVVAANDINKLLTTERDGSELKTHNEIKINNPILSGIGLMRTENQPVFFEGVPESALEELWHGQVPDFVHSGPQGTAPRGALVVPQSILNAAKASDLPVMILNSNVQ